MIETTKKGFDYKVTIAHPQFVEVRIISVDNTGQWLLVVYQTVETTPSQVKFK